MTTFSQYLEIKAAQLYPSYFPVKAGQDTAKSGKPLLPSDIIERKQKVAKIHNFIRNMLLVMEHWFLDKDRNPRSNLSEEVFKNLNRISDQILEKIRDSRVDLGISLFEELIRELKNIEEIEEFYDGARDNANISLTQIYKLAT